MNKKTPPPMHPCNVTGCARKVRAEHWACSVHWYVIPLSKRNRLSRAWQTLKAARAAPAAATVLQAALAEYRAAEAAILAFFSEGKTDAAR